MSIRVVIADDHKIVRSGLECLFEQTDIVIVAQAVNGKEAVQLCFKHQPDVMLIDIRMVDSDGLDAIESIRAELPDLPIVVLSTYDNPTYVARCVALGISDYVLKGAPREEIVGAIQRAAAGEAPTTESVMRKIQEAMAKRREDPAVRHPLTNRETQVLRHIALGLSNREIGLSLKISVETVKEHVQNILRKVNVTDRTQAAVWAVRKGIM